MKNYPQPFSLLSREIVSELEKKNESLFCNNLATTTTTITLTKGLFDTKVNAINK